LTKYKVNVSKVSKNVIQVECPSCNKSVMLNIKKMLSAEEVDRTNKRPIHPEDILSDTGVRIIGDILTVTINGRKETPLILIADEPRPFRTFLRRSLEEMGCRVIVLDDGADAEEYLRTSETPHIAFLNVVLPNLMGFELCERIKANVDLRNIKIVLIGAIFRIDRFRRDPTNLYGADDYIEEIIVKQDLRERMRRLLGLPMVQDTGAEGEPVDLLDHARRLARIILSDIIIYNIQHIDQWILEDRFRIELAAEIEEGEDFFCSKVPSNRPEIPEIYHHTIDEYLRRRKRELLEGKHP
jgi:CheY-like chemotaxis protein